MPDVRSEKVALSVVLTWFFFKVSQRNTKTTTTTQTIKANNIEYVEIFWNV